MSNYKLKEIYFTPIPHEKGVFFEDHLQRCADSCNENHFYMCGASNICSCPVLTFTCPFVGYQCKEITKEMWRDMYEKTTV